ncbi:MAG: hypothetical protein JF597_28530 [Streptomyces sp.]|nr:hypothetical protein [Streptomyces sp.]
MLVAAGAVAAVVLMASGGDGSTDGKPGTSSPSHSGSPRPSLGLPTELPSSLPSGLPSELPSQWPSELPSELPSGLDSLLPSLLG